jgi:hypothetical protein
MSRLFDEKISHDKITRFLNTSYFDSTSVWQAAKPLVREYQSAEDGVLIVDDSIVEKAHTDENPMICWHYDHALGRMVKGINFLSLLYSSGELSVPINVHVIEKTVEYTNESGETKYKSPQTKNQITQQMVRETKRQHVPWRYLLADNWFSSHQMMNFIAEQDKHYIFALKSNRTVALSESDRRNGIFHRVDEIAYPEDGKPLQVYIRKVAHPVVLVRQIFTNKDESQGIRYLVSNDTTLDRETLTTIYKKRWKVEEYHKSVKQHTAIAGSPTKTAATQANHVFAAFIAYIKLETIKLRSGLNHFAVKSIIMGAATKAAFLALRQFFA